MLFLETGYGIHPAATIQFHSNFLNELKHRVETLLPKRQDRDSLLNVGSAPWWYLALIVEDCGVDRALY